MLKCWDDPGGKITTPFGFEVVGSKTPQFLRSRMRYSPNLNKRNVRKIIIRDDARTEVDFCFCKPVTSQVPVQ